MVSKAITVGEQHSGCPYLGTTVDSRTRFVYASQRAACYANSKPVSILLGHQETYCFADKYVECPIFTQPKNEPASKRRLFMLPILLLTIFALVLLAILIAFATRGTGAKQRSRPGRCPQRGAGGHNCYNRCFSTAVENSKP